MARKRLRSFLPAARSMRCCWALEGAVGTRKVGDMEVKEKREVSSLITRCETEVSAVKREAAMCIDPPFVWMLGHDDEARALSSKPPSPHKSELRGAANSASENKSPSVEKALMLKSLPDEVNVVLHHVGVETPWTRG